MPAFTIDISRLLYILLAGGISVLLADVIHFYFAHGRPPFIAGEPPIVCFPRLKYIGSPGFFMTPYRFLHQSREYCKDSWFQFGVRNHNVFAVFGEDARKLFFTNKNFSFLEGYGLLSPGVQKIIPAKPKEGTDSFAWFVRKFTRTDVIEPYLVHMLADIDREMSTWGSQGLLDPFVSFHKLVFQVAARITVGDEMANDPIKLRKAIDAFHYLAKGSTPVSLILPWFPTLSRIRRILAGFTLYRLFSGAIQSRKQSGNFQQDILQTLLDESDEQLDDMRITKLLIMSAFAAGTNTGPIIAWLHIYLDQHPYWKTKVLQEVDAFAADHSFGNPQSIVESLKGVSLSTWEESLPSLELCLQETMRLRLIGAITRRNVGSDVKLGSHTIPRGDFVMYMSADVHLDNTLYPDPHIFDPARNQSHAAQIGFLGWGAGNHPCTGQRLAKAMTKIISMTILSRFTLEARDKEGNRLVGVPRPKFELFNVGLPEETVYFRYTMRHASCNALAFCTQASPDPSSFSL